MNDSTMAERVQVLVLGTADWNQPIATNQHYAVRELCKEERLEVVFVESLGLRRPELRWRDLRRMARRLRIALSRSSATLVAEAWRPVPEGLTVRSLLVIPWHSGLAAVINRRILSSRLASWSGSTAKKVLWTYTPVTYGLEQHADATIYHCVDLLGEVAGIDRSVVNRNEAQLAAAGAAAIATSMVVADHLAEVGFAEVHCWENVADTEVMAAAEPVGANRSAGRVLFAGNLAPQKVDFALLRELSASGLDVRVAGPHAEGGGHAEAEFADLVEAGVTYLGMLSLRELAQEMVHCTVGLIPYVINDYTRGVSPLKTYEYLAAGLAVVATELPGVPADLTDVWCASDPGAFIARVKAASGVPTEADLRRRVQTAAAHSWISRGRDIRSIAVRVAG